MVCEATFTLPTGYPAALPLELTLECDQIPYPRLSEIIATLHVTFPVDGEMKVWEMCEWLKENAAKYGGVDSGGGGDSNHQSQDDEARPCGGFMREWCSFVSLYVYIYAATRCGGFMHVYLCHCASICAFVACQTSIMIILCKASMDPAVLELQGSYTHFII